MKAAQSLCPQEHQHLSFKTRGAIQNSWARFAGWAYFVYAGGMYDQVIFEAADEKKLEGRTKTSQRLFAVTEENGHLKTQGKQLPTTGS